MRFWIAIMRDPLVKTHVCPWVKDARLDSLCIKCYQPLLRGGFIRKKNMNILVSFLSWTNRIFNFLPRYALQRSSADAILKICLRNHSRCIPCTGVISSVSYVKYMGYWVWLSISFCIGLMFLLPNKLQDSEFWHVYSLLCIALLVWKENCCRMLHSTTIQLQGHWTLPHYFLAKETLNCLRPCVCCIEYR